MKSKIILVLGLMFVLGNACNEDDLTQLNPNQLSPENFFKDEAQIESAVFAAYTPLRSLSLTGRLYYFFYDLIGDAHIPSPQAFSDAALMNTGAITSANGIVRDMWRALYLSIHRANTALDGIAASETVDAAVKVRLEAEARFVRGWAYNELATLYGGVPISTSQITSVAGTKGRSTEAESFNQAQADLEFAANNLPSTRPASEWGRATAGMALGILARSHMQENELTEARAALDDLINLDVYRLADDFTLNFAENNFESPEIIFPVVFSDIVGINWGGSSDGQASRSIRGQEYGPNWRNVVPSQKLVDAFEYDENGDPMDDPRRRFTIIFEGETPLSGDDGPTSLNGNTEGLIWPESPDGEPKLGNILKYTLYYQEDQRNINGQYQSQIDFVVMRYADALLLLAEIEAREGNLDAARTLINQVRNRVGLIDIEESNIPNTTQDEVIQAVIRERFVELASEQVRHRDLVRWGKFGVINPTDERPWFEVGKHELLPIPLVEIQTNPNLTDADQNPGY